MTDKPSNAEQIFSVQLKLTGQQSRDLLRFNETTEDGQDYDVPKERMKSLAALGLIRWVGGSRYEFTDAGCAILTKPAEQHQGESSEYPPCDYCGIVPDHHPWHGSGLLSGVENRHIHACDACRGQLPLHPGQHQGEPIAVLYANGSVLTKADCGDYFEICCKVETPLYTHADAGEVERLREQVETLRLMTNDYLFETERLRAELAGTIAESERRRNCCADLIEERDTLRAQLAEQDALTQAVKNAGKVAHLYHSGGGLLEWINSECAALSASAEPSAPFEHQFRNAVITGHSHPEIFTTPVERDERAEFESAFLKHLEKSGWNQAFFKMMLQRKEDDEYSAARTDGAWYGWKARANLERKP